jgi:hypothetical protein
MTTLKQLLDDLEIEVEDDKKDDEIDLKNVKLEDITEEQRPIFEKALNIINDQTTELSKRELIINTLKEDRVKPQTVIDEDKEEKILGVLDTDDQYAPAFKKLADAIEGISKKDEINEQEQFEENLKTFAIKNKDIVKYVKDMDKLLFKHPTLSNDIPTLYHLAKNISEGREKLKGNKREELESKDNLVFENSGQSLGNVTNITQAKTIGEAFELAQKKIGGK